MTNVPARIPNEATPASEQTTTVPYLWLADCPQPRSVLLHILAIYALIIVVLLVGIGFCIPLGREFGMWIAGLLYLILILGLLSFSTTPPETLRKLGCVNLVVDHNGLTLPYQTRANGKWAWDEILEVSIDQGSRGVLWHEGHVLVIRTARGEQRLSLWRFSPADTAKLMSAFRQFCPDKVREDVLTRVHAVNEFEKVHNEKYRSRIWSRQILQRSITVFEPFAKDDSVSDRRGHTAIITRVLRSGGISALYECSHSEFGHCALRQVCLSGFDAEVKERLFAALSIRSEAFKQTDLPTLSSIKAHFSQGDFFFVLYEMPQGSDLRQFVLSKNGLGAKQALLLTQAIIRCIDNSSAPNLVIGDLSPDSVFVTRSGAITVLPVSSIGPSVAESGGDVVAGTFGFVAPEFYVSGPSSACDVFSLGSLLYFMVTACEPDQLYGLHAALKDVDSVVHQATQYDPDRRPTLSQLGELVESAIAQVRR